MPATKEPRPSVADGRDRRSRLDGIPVVIRLRKTAVDLLNRLNISVFTLLVTCALSTTAAETPTGPAVLDWERLPPLPDREGFAGMFAGVSGDETTGKALVLAGGANFPEGRPWDDGEKAWYDNVYVLADPDAEWQTGWKLPRPSAYGVSVTTDDGVICIGGGNADRHYADVFRLKWTGQEIVTERLPSLPEPAAFLSGALLDDVIYVAGGKDWPKPYRPHGSPERLPVSMKTFWALDLSKPGGEWAWKQLEPWPGPARMQAVAAAQQSKFFLLSGVNIDNDLPDDDKRVFLTDGYAFDPKRGMWSKIADLPRPASAAPSPAMPLGQAAFAVVGGDDGANADRVAELKESHPGFLASLLCYHTITDTWAARGEYPRDPEKGFWPPVTTSTTTWRGRYVVPSGEAKPGIRTPEVFWAEQRDSQSRFGWLDYIVLGLYLGALVGMGFYFSRREKTTGDFFLGGRRIPWWAAGLSIFGTQLSAITFMAIPGKSFHTDWLYFLGNMMIVAIAPVVVYLYLPFFRRLNVTTAYEYLERRFSGATRLVGSGAFLLFQAGRMGVVLYLPAAALHTVTGMDVYLCIGVMGVLATLYTVLGGIEAVVWTDVLQVFVLLGGALLALAIIAFEVDGGLPAIVAEGAAAGKFRMVNVTWDVTAAALWIVLLGKPIETLISYTADQTVVQRYLTTSDEEAAARGIWTNAALTIPASIIFFGVGTALWAFYRGNPAMLNPTGRIDDVFPWFIAQQLPAGIAGLVIAGLFAAAMSSLDSSMNSMATAVTTDFYRRLNPLAADARCLRLARWLTVVFGTIGTAFALYMAYLDSTSMWDQYIKIIGLFGGGLAGLFALGIFTRRTTAPGALIGFAASAALLFWVQHTLTIHAMLYPAISMGSCVLVGYTVSLLLPGDGQSREGLTIYTVH